MSDEKQRTRERREEEVKLEAIWRRKSLVYVDDDGCEVTVTPSGHVFYNVADWW
jgi:hypothetical protein